MNYKKATIYKLINNVDDKIYIGSTCLSLRDRFYSDKLNATIKVNRFVNKHLNLIGWDNVKIELIEYFPCSNKMELLRRKRHWIETLNPKLNKQLPIVVELPAATKDEKKEYDMQYKKLGKYKEYNKLYSLQKKMNKVMLRCENETNEIKQRMKNTDDQYNKIIKQFN